MLRLIHAQTTAGPILIDDIDDGLPNKTARRLGGAGDPKAYERDGYANKPKQPCYVPRLKATDTSIAGYIDLDETNRVTLSAGKGKIKGFLAAGFISVVSFDASDLGAPTISSAVVNATTRVLTITGTKLLSVSPDFTTVVVNNTKASLLVPGADANGGVRYTAVASTIAGESVRVRHVISGTNTALAIGVSGNDITVTVATNGGGAATSTAAQIVTAIGLSAPATALVTSAATGTGGGITAAIAYTNLDGFGSITLTQSQITGGSGTISDTSIVLPAALVPGALVTHTTVTVTADDQSVGPTATT